MENQIEPRSSFLKRWGLALVMFVLFLGFTIAQLLSGFHAYNEELTAKRLPLFQTLGDYALSGHFVSSLFENWESEFLQMGLFVYLTVFLYQVGSSESKPLPEDESEHTKEENWIDAQWSKKRFLGQPVRKIIYENSLSLALFGLFLVSFLGHAYGSMQMTNFERVHAGQPTIGYADIFLQGEFWFESFQNWQSEFLAVFAIGILSIKLRQRGSPQSKKLRDSTWKTGDA